MTALRAVPASPSVSVKTALTEGLFSWPSTAAGNDSAVMVTVPAGTQRSSRTSRRGVWVRGRRQRERDMTAFLPLRRATGVVGRSGKQMIAAGGGECQAEWGRVGAATAGAAGQPVPPSGPLAAHV